MKNSKQILSESSFILVLSTALVKIISAVFKIPLATDTFLGDLGFGYFSVAHDLYMPFYVLAISGLPVAVSHITAEFLAKKCYGEVKNNFNITKKLFILLGIAFSLLVSLLAVPLILNSQSGKDTLYSILAVVPSIFLCFIISVYRGYFEGFSNMYPTAVSKVIEAVTKLCLGLVFSYIVIKQTSNSALAAAAAMTAVSIGTLLATVYLHFKFKLNNPLNKFESEPNSNLSSVTFKTILILAIPFALSSLASSLVALIDVFTVKLHIANASAEYLNTLKSMYITPSEISSLVDFDISTYLYGIRSKAFTIYNLIPTITMSLGVGALPVLTKFWVSKDFDSLRNNATYTLKLITTVTFPAAIGLTLLGGPIMNLLYSSDDTLGGNLLAIYGIAAIFAGLAIPLTTVLQSFGYHYKALKHIIIGIVLKIISNISLVIIPQVNVYAAPIGTLICYLYILVAFIVLIKKVIKNLDFKNTLLKPFLSAMICGISAFLITMISNSKLFVLLSILTAALVYFSALFLLRTFTKQELSNFPILSKFKSFKNAVK